MNRTSKYIHARFHAGLGQPYRPRALADIIPLRRRRDHDAVAPVVGFVLLAIAAWICLAAMLAIALRTGQDVISHLVPGWPWW